MKKVIKEARENAGIHIVHLLPLWAQIEEIEAQFDKSVTFEDAWLTALAYKTALNHPLTLSQFVPCDSEGKPIEKGMVVLDWVDEEQDKEIEKHKKAYEQAQKAVLFEGFEVEKNAGGSILTNGFLEVAFLKVREGFVIRVAFFDSILRVSRPKNLKDLAEFTKDNPLKLKQ